MEFSEASDSMTAMENNGDENGSSYDNGYNDSEAYMPANEFELMNSVVGDGIQKDKELGISNVTFDTYEELLWMGTRSGHVTSYYGVQMQKYTSFQVHPTEEVRSILTMESGILALSPTGLRSQFRRGIPCFTHTSEDMTDMHSLLVNGRTGRVIMGGLQEKLIDFDVASSKPFTVVNDVKEGTNAILRDHSRFVVSGDVPSGRVHLRDPLTLKVAHTLDAHSGVLSDLDVHGHHLVTCGSHAASRAPDRFLMVYDLRILRAISPLQLMIVPYQLRFLPSMSSRIVVLSSLGQVQLVDTAALSTPSMSMFQVHSGLEGCNIMSLDISPSNQCLAFGDTSNSLHLYSSVPEPILNPYARDSEFADPIEHLPSMDITDDFANYASIPRPHLSVGQNNYCSDFWPERFMKQAYRPTPEIDSDILKSMKIVGTIGYARNLTNAKRNVVRYPNLKTKQVDSTTNFRSHHGSHGGEDQENTHQGTGAPSAAMNLIPKYYRKVVAKLSKMGTDDFDFDRYNRTGFCGLEASLPNAYCNAMLQILYFNEKLRIVLLNHTCSRENCICCELSFLFHMMDISPGMPCQSANFLRALRTIPEASALGLIFTESNAVWGCNVPRLVQSWNRFILQQIYVQISPSADKDKVSRLYAKPASSPSKAVNSKPTTVEDMGKEISEALDQPRQVDGLSENSETENEESLFNKLFGMVQEKVNVCTRCKEKKAKNDTVLLCNIIYPESKEEQKFSFEEVVCSSMCPEQTTPAWCEQCRKYQTTSQIRNLKTLPNVLSLNAGMDNAQDVAFWINQMEHMYKDVHSDDANMASTKDDDKKNLQEASKVASSVNSTQLKPCRYGNSCTRPDCKFWHPESESVIPKPAKVDIGAKCASLGISWIPKNMILNLHSNGKVSCSGNADAETEDITTKQLYELYGICWAILDPSTGKAVNIVASINVGPTYHARTASHVSQWYVFNDFGITTITITEATAVHPTWKIPCILFYQSKEMEPSLREVSLNNPITSEVFLEDKSLAQRGGRKRITFIPLGPEEMPKVKDLVAIDAEFVTLNQEESELRSDGKVSTIKAAQMSVARITCVRGSGPMEGTPFIDDYISTQEQVVDYVTKFSGIKPGDLDANFSSKHLTTLKSTYKKLRYLVDTGVIFIGHGLKNDFKVINIVVPPEQVIDTVLLFHLPHHRMVSLKFLAWYFLDQKIQGITHDSIEDAVTALRLYKKYLQLKAEDKLIEALNGLYDKGKTCNWKVPEQDEE